jgi:hypothetical protein
MAQLISEIWAGLREAGMPEVMLYLPDNSASRCHWDDTTTINDVRVALLADQDRQIVRILPVDSCVGIGIASPKGIDPSGYKLFVYKKLCQRNGEFVEPDASESTAAEPPPPLTVAPPPPPAVEPPPPPKPDPVANRWGVAMKQAGASRYAGTSNGRG